nr:hypothetical protein [Sphingomonas sp. Root710]
MKLEKACHRSNSGRGQLDHCAAAVRFVAIPPDHPRLLQFVNAAEKRGVGLIKVIPDLLDAEGVTLELAGEAQQHDVPAGLTKHRGRKYPALGQAHRHRGSGALNQITACATTLVLSSNDRRHQRAEMTVNGVTTTVLTRSNSNALLNVKINTEM